MQIVEKLKLEWNQELELALTYLKSGIVEVNHAAIGIKMKSPFSIGVVCSRMIKCYFNLCTVE